MKVRGVVKVKVLMIGTEAALEANDVEAQKLSMISAGTRRSLSRIASSTSQAIT
jgi:hypothetical protein